MRLLAITLTISILTIVDLAPPSAAIHFHHPAATRFWLHALGAASLTSLPPSWSLIMGEAREPATTTGWQGSEPSIADTGYPSSPPPPPRPTSPQLRSRFARPSVDHLSSPQRRARRRSSLLSFGSLDDAANSFHEDIIQPSTAKMTPGVADHEITHWASTPLAFAILPAVSGLVFKNGSAFVTDALLLTLAAIFMNWSIRVPREWYHSAQVVRRDIEPGFRRKRASFVDDSAIFEEEEADGEPRGRGDGEGEDEQAAGETTQPDDDEEQDSQDLSARERAAAQLRTQELFALFACFVFPVAAAYLLHVIRSQLSRPSESLVSDYNLSIFTIAAELWPARQVIRLVAARTLHLQRVVSGLDDPAVEPALRTSPDTAALMARIEALETQFTTAPLTSGSATPLQPSDLAGLDLKIQKRLEPRLDSIERAVRRYEKRYTTLAMVTEQRFQNLETRMQDTLSLAAVAAQHSQKSSSIIRSAFSTSIDVVTLPGKLAWELATWPMKVVQEIFSRVMALMVGRRARRREEKRKVPRTELRIKDDKLVREKPPRKLVR